MHGAASRDSLAAARDRLDELARSLPDGAGFNAIAESLFGVAGLLGSQPRLRRALTEPSRVPEDRATLARDILGSHLGPTELDLVVSLAKAKWSVPGDLADAVEVLAVQALFTVAEAENKLDDTEDALFRFGRIIDREPTLRAVLTDPAVTADRKVALLRDLLGTRAPAAALRLLEFAATSPRGRTIDTILDEFTRLAAERRQKLVATVHTAVELDGQQLTRLAQSLTRKYGRPVHLQVVLEPELLGGLSVRIGDEVIDGSVAGRLDEVRRRFSA